MAAAAADWSGGGRKRLVGELAASTEGGARVYRGRCRIKRLCPVSSVVLLRQYRSRSVVG